jgi:3-hydroxyisobutyrate dehydrogenase-like beta-hydroxyacid dehydrogenase
VVSKRDYDHIAARRVGFIGLGVMGYPMAGHLARAGHRVTVYNRTPGKAQAWASEYGGASADSPHGAAEGADVVISCVGNDADLRNVVLGSAGGLGALARDSVWVDHTTASAEVAREMAVQTAARGVQFIDAPVSGGNIGAANGTLTIMCGGDPAAFERIRPVVLAYARAVTRIGASGAGQLAKMVNQTAVAGLLQGLAEAIAFGEKSGLDMKLVLDVIAKGAAQSWQLENRGPTMIEGRFDFGFAVDLMRKDLGLVLDEARHNGARLPVTALVDQFYADLQAQGDRRLDTSSLIKRLRS